MSTYLLAWAVSKYEFAKSVSARGVEFEAFYAKASLIQHAADVGAKMLDHFEQKVFGINYNLPKMDIVAVERYESAAMENWGMMTFRTEVVLRSVDWARVGFDKNYPSVDSFDIFEQDLIMAHELVRHYNITPKTQEVMYKLTKFR